MKYSYNIKNYPILRVTCLLLGLLVSLETFSQAKPKTDYLTYVQNFANTLIEHGTDNYGPRKTAMWASVIDTRDLTVPREGVPPTEGVRPHDRAVGGSNLYHDVYTVRLFKTLTKITNDSRYQEAASSYLNDFLSNCQSEATGLFGWGEHLFYDFYEDRVSPAARYKERNDYSHEFLASTPLFEELWELDPERTQRSIEGLRLHFLNPDSVTWLFNRHAYWNKNEHQTIVMPWIKHSALYTYAYLFLASKNQDDQILRKARGIGNLYWSQRNPDTNLTMSCLYHKTEPGVGKVPALSGMSYLSYWIYKGTEFTPTEESLRERSLKMFNSILEYSWDADQQKYYDALNLDGSPMLNLDTKNPEDKYKYAPVYPVGYGTYSIINTGRIAAYLAKKEKNDFYEETVLRIAEVANATALPKAFTAEHLANVIHLNLDAFDISGDQKYLNQAKKIADIAIRDLYRNGLFVREFNDPYYEAKLYIGDMVSGLLRLHLAQDTKLYKQFAWDWSI